MLNPALTNALDECLWSPDPLAAAKQSEFEETLLPLIRTAQLVQRTPLAVPSLKAEAAGLLRLTAAVEEEKRARQAPQKDDGAPSKPSSFHLSGQKYITT